MKILSLFFISCIAFMLTACGQVGPLYLPNQRPPVYVPPAHADKPSAQKEQS